MTTPKKEQEPKRVAKARTIKAAVEAQRVAEPEPIIMPAPVPTTPEPATPVLPEPVIPTDPEPAKPSLWHRFEHSKWFLIVIGVMILIIIWFVVDEIQNAKVRKSIKQTQQTDVQVQAQKGDLSVTEQNLSGMQNNSSFGKLDTDRLLEIETAIKGHIEFEAKMLNENERLKKENEILQAKIANADTASLREYGRKDANR